MPMRTELAAAAFRCGWDRRDNGGAAQQLAGTAAENLAVVMIFSGIGLLGAFCAILASSDIAAFFY